MRIGSNIPSLLAQRALDRTTKALARSLGRLASGQRINRAADDAAGLAISIGLESQTRGLARVAKNINDGKSLLAVADGSIASQIELVQRMEELTIQSANGTLSEENRSYLQKEMEQLIEEFNRIAEQADFNGRKLLDGSFGTSSLQINLNKGEKIEFSLSDSRAATIFKTEALAGSGTFQAAATITTSNSPTEIAAGDFNGDGNKDFLVGLNSPADIVAYFGNGDGTFSSSTVLGGVGGLAHTRAVDLNNDGLDDFIATRTFGSGDIIVGLGKKDGTFTTSTEVVNPSFPFTIETGDFDGDQFQDYIYQNLGDGILRLKRGNGDGTFKPAENLGITGAYEMEAADFNRDGNLDLAMAFGVASQVPVRLGNGDGTFKSPVTTFGTTDLNNVSWADFNNDGKIDLAHDGFYIHLANGDGTFGSALQTSVPVGTTRGQTLFGDFNSDGNVDLVIAEDGASNNQVPVLFGKGDGTFTKGQTLIVGNGVDYSGRYGAVADFDNDGFEDLVISNFGASSISVRLLKTEMRTTVSELDISTQSNAQDVLAVLKSGLSQLVEKRSHIGAIQNRLESVQSVSAITLENLSSAKSQITDVDYADEVAELTRRQLLQQVQVSVLGQANMQMSAVLKLLQF